jgi:GntR family transcriptional regulator
VYNKRGIGFFVAPDAVQTVLAYRRERFLQQELPAFFNTISLLGIGFEELAQRYEQFKAASSTPSSLATPHEK